MVVDVHFLNALGIKVCLVPYISADEGMFVVFWRAQEKPSILKIENWKPFFCECEGKKKRKREQATEIQTGIFSVLIVIILVAEQAYR